MEQAANLFAKGLQLDTHPMVLGNDTMSDCLNGTFVTMNGDEVILQNDMGNRKVDNAFLPAGYEPVGIKEYGGIIYLALYNPITNKSLLGSFPSPERIINGAETDGISIDFIPEYEIYKGLYFLKSNYNLSILSSDSLLRAGDKFALYWENTDNNIIENLSNYDNIFKDGNIDKVDSPKNKKYTLKIGVLNSLNEFVDITDNLIRWKQESGEEEKQVDTSDKTDLYKQNVGYFVLNSFTPNLRFNVATKDKEVIEQRLAVPINTYSYKLVGPLCVKQIFNTIELFNYDIQAVQLWIPTTLSKYNSTSNENYKKLEEIEGLTVYYIKVVELTITANITYNRPDGISSSSPVGGSDDNYYSYYDECEVNSSSLELNGFDLYNNNSGIYELINQGNGVTIEPNYGETKYNSSTNLYTVTISKTYQLPIDDFFPTDNNDTFNYFIGVDSGHRTISDDQHNNKTLLLKEFSEEDSIKLSDIQSGGINLDYWRYYVYDEHTFDLTYRFSAYPRSGLTFDNLRIRFTPVTIENIPSDANARIQEEVVDDGDIQQSEQQHQSNITDNITEWSTIIVDKNGNEYTPVDDSGEGYATVIDHEGNEYDLDNLDDYSILHRFDGNIILDDYEVLVNEELRDNYQLYGEGEGYQIYVGNGNSSSNTSSNDESSNDESSNLSSEQSQGESSEENNSDYFLFTIEKGNISNGRVTYHFENLSLPSLYRTMYKIDLFVNNSHKYIEHGLYVAGDETFKCFLLNTTLFNKNYSTTSDYYVEDFRKFNTEDYNKYLKINLDILTNEIVETIDQYTSETGNPFKDKNTQDTNIEYTVTLTKSIKILPKYSVGIENENLYPNYIERPDINSITPEITREDNSLTLYNNIRWVNWSESTPPKNEMINVEYQNNYIIKIENSDKFLCVGEVNTLDLTNVFIPIRDALIDELERVGPYKTVLVNWTNDNAAADGHDMSVGIYTFNNLLSTDARNPVKLSDGNREQRVLLSKYLDIITLEFNDLDSSPFTFVFYYHGDSGRVIRFRRENDTNLNGPSSENFARLWWRNYNSSYWVTFDNAIYNDNDYKGLIRCNYDGHHPELSELIFTNIFPNSTFFSNASLNEEFYICYHQNLIMDFLIPGHSKKYNEFYNSNLNIKTNYIFSNINITNASTSDIENYFIPRFYSNGATTSDIVLISIKSDEHFHQGINNNFISEYSHNVILSNGVLYNRDSKQKELLSYKVYSLNNGIIKPIVLNPFKIIPNENSDNYMILCNSYSIKAVVNNYPIDICLGGTLHHNPSASYKNTYFFKPVTVEYES